MATMHTIEPKHDCALCARLERYRNELRRERPEWFNAPVPSFGPLTARLLIVGLAPGRAGANRTGRPFTGDAAGAVLFPALAKAGFAQGRYDARPDDSFTLLDCRITNAVRCAPPANLPLAAELQQCGGFLKAEIAAMPRLKGILALGGIAHSAACSSLVLQRRMHPFRHGAFYKLEGDRFLLDSYHCSRKNIAVGRFSAQILDDLLAETRRRLGKPMACSG